MRRRTGADRPEPSCQAYSPAIPKLSQINCNLVAVGDQSVTLSGELLQASLRAFALLGLPALEGRAHASQRYMVPIAGPMAAAAAITLWTLTGMERIGRRTSEGLG